MKKSITSAEASSLINEGYGFICSTDRTPSKYLEYVIGLGDQYYLVDNEGLQEMIPLINNEEVIEEIGG
jgi:hypothetical protein